MCRWQGQGEDCLVSREALEHTPESGEEGPWPGGGPGVLPISCLVLALVAPQVSGQEDLVEGRSPPGPPHRGTYQVDQEERRHPGSEQSAWQGSVCWGTGEPVACGRGRSKSRRRRCYQAIQERETLAAAPGAGEGAGAEPLPTG